MYDLAVFFDMNIMARHDLLIRVHALTGQKLEILRHEVGLQCLASIAEIFKRAALRLCNPRLVRAVAAKNNAAVVGERLLYEVVQSAVEVLRALKLSRKAAELVRHDGVEHCDGTGDGLAWSPPCGTQTCCR